MCGYTFSVGKRDQQDHGAFKLEILLDTDLLILSVVVLEETPHSHVQRGTYLGQYLICVSQDIPRCKELHL